MIARCDGHDCPLKTTCYRWLMPSNKSRNAWTQSMYSILHHSCRNYWAVKVEESNTIDDHARMLDAMIKRINLMEKREQKN